MRRGYRRFAARVTRWALDHPWRYAALYTSTVFAAWTLTTIAIGSTPVHTVVEAAVIAFVPSMLFMRWLCARPYVRRRWERRAEYMAQGTQGP